jgi:translation initiation factor 2B subunit (eIF-2B alpha/beta/delta family)
MSLPDSRPDHLMSMHPSIQEVIEKFRDKQLHAAQSGREVIRSIAKVSHDCQASKPQLFYQEIEASIDALLTILPAYAPPINAMHLVMSHLEDALKDETTVDELKAIVTSVANNYSAWSENAREKIANCAAEIIPQGATVFTFTLSETMINTFRAASHQNKKFRILVTESRPNNDGRVTAKQLAKEGIPVEISIDSSMGEMLQRADLMLVGAEAVLTDGSVICKVGTYPAALVANSMSVPVFIVVDTMKFDLTSVLGIPMKLEPLNNDDVFGPGCAKTTRVVGHLFDRTPPELIRGLVTEKGVLNSKDCRTLIGNMRQSNKMIEKLHVWAHQGI